MAVMKIEGTVDRVGLVRATPRGAVYAIKVGSTAPLVFSVPEAWLIHFALMKPGDRIKLDVKANGSVWELMNCLHHELSGGDDLARELLTP